MNILTRSITVLFSLLLPVMAGAQYYMPQNSHWVMSKAAGLYFNGSLPVPQSSEIGMTECSAAISDNAGNLLFYSDGMNVWDRNGMVMPNGRDINGSGVNTHSTTQGVLIVPFPGNPDLYYVFSLVGYLYMNVVDMSLNNGNGDIVTGYPLRGMIWNDQLGEKMIAIRGCDNNVWLVTRSHLRSEFLAFDIHRNGLSLTPVISSMGILPPQDYFQGEMKASVDGSKIVTVSTPRDAAVELFKFDIASGQVYQQEVIERSRSSYGVAFSPDGSKLYVSDMIMGGQMVQYDLLDNNAPTFLGRSAGVTQIKLGQDGKVYFIAAMGALGQPDYSFLGRINEPNQAGFACMFEEAVPSLRYVGGMTNGLGMNLPTEIVTASESGEGNNELNGRLLLDTLICSAEPTPVLSITLRAFGQFSNYVWDNNSTGTTRTVDAPGVYWVRYATRCGDRTDTFRINLHQMLPVDIQNDNGLLRSVNTHDNYQWYKDGQPIAGATSAWYRPSVDGWYTLVVIEANGCTASGSFQLKAEETGVGELDGNSQFSIYPNPARDLVVINAGMPVTATVWSVDGRSVASAGDNNTFSVAGLAPGVYFVQVRSRKDGTVLGVQKLVRQ